MPSFRQRGRDLVPRPDVVRKTVKQDDGEPLSIAAIFIADRERRGLDQLGGRRRLDLSPWVDSGEIANERCAGQPSRSQERSAIDFLGHLQGRNGWLLDDYRVHAELATTTLIAEHARARRIFSENVSASSAVSTDSSKTVHYRAGFCRYARDAASSLSGVTLSGSMRTIRYVM